MKYVVKSNLRHDGRAYRIDETVEMPDGQAKALQAAGVIEAVVANDAPDAPDAPAGDDGHTWDFLTEAQFAALLEAGYKTAMDVEKASDEELLAVPGIGKTAVKRIREALA